MRTASIVTLTLLIAARVNSVPFSFVPKSELPVEIQTGIQTSDCIFPLYDVINIYSQLGNDIVNAFQYQDAGIDKWMLRYALLSPPGTISSYAFLSAQNSYDVAASDSHAFTLYYPGGMVNYGGSHNPGDPVAVMLTLNDAGLVKQGK